MNQQPKDWVTHKITRVYPASEITTAMYENHVEDLEKYRLQLERRVFSPPPREEA